MVKNEELKVNTKKKKASQYIFILEKLNQWKMRNKLSVIISIIQ